MASTPVLVQGAIGSHIQLNIVDSAGAPYPLIGKTVTFFMKMTGDTGLSLERIPNTINDSGEADYITIAGDLSEPGTLQVQARVEIFSGLVLLEEYWSDFAYFTVKPNIGNPEV